jgi:hypothetical protein
MSLASAALLPTLFAFGCGGDDDSGVTPATTSITSVSVNPTSVVGGNASQGSVTVSPTPSSAVNVGLSSSNAAATVPGSVTVNGGATTGSFTVNTTAVAAQTAVTITASLNGTQTTTLTVTPPNVPTARFVVRSLSDAKRKLNTDPAPVTILPAGTLDACPLVPNPQGNASFDCVFDGGTSTAPTPIQQYIWAYFVGPRQRGPDPNDPHTTSTTPVLKPDESSCNFFGGLQGTSAGGLQFISMRVDLQVRDATGLSTVVSSQNIRIFPAGQCGYGF